MDKVNNTVVSQAKFKGKLMAFHAVTIGDKTHKLETTKGFNTTGTSNFTPHYTSHTVALNGFHSVLDFDHILQVFKELDVVLPTDVTLTWFKMMDDDSYLLQIQSPSEESIHEIKKKREDLQRLSIACMDWSVSLQNNLIFVAKLSKDRKQPHKQIVITPPSKAKEPAVDSSKKPVLDASGFQTATNKSRNSRNKPKANGSEYKEEKISLVTPVPLQVNKSQNTFDALAKTQDNMEETQREEAEADANKAARTQEQAKQDHALEEEKQAAAGQRLREQKKALSDKKAKLTKQFKTLKQSVGQKLSKNNRVSAEHSTLIDAYLEPVFSADNGNYEQAIEHLESILKMEDETMLVTLLRTGTDISLASSSDRKRGRQPNYNESSSSSVETDASMSDGEQGSEDTHDSPTATVVEQTMGRPPEADRSQREVSEFFKPTTSQPCLNTPQT
jgi:hypothetical protein